MLFGFRNNIEVLLLNFCLSIFIGVQQLHQGKAKYSNKQIMKLQIHIITNKYFIYFSSIIINLTSAKTIYECLNVQCNYALEYNKGLFNITYYFYEKLIKVLTIILYLFINQ